MTRVLNIPTSIDQYRVAHSVVRLAEPRHGDALFELYIDRLDYPSARATLGVRAKELEGLHQSVLAALVECMDVEGYEEHKERSSESLKNQ